MDIGEIAIVTDALKIVVDLVWGVGGEFRWHCEGQDGHCIVCFLFTLSTIQEHRFIYLLKRARVINYGPVAGSDLVIEMH